MDNVVLKTEGDFSYGKVVNFPKRIKLSEKSSNNVFTKISRLLPKKESDGQIISFPHVYLEQSNLPSTDKASDNQKNSFSQTHLEQYEQNSSISQPAENQTYNNQNVGTVLENVDLNDCSQYISQVFTNISSRLIRLTPLMYDRIGEHASSIKREEKVELSEISVSEVEEQVDSFVSTDAAVKFDFSDVKNAADDAFDSVPAEVDEKEDNNGVKKASYTKAKVKKYKLNEHELPTNMLSGNSLFGSTLDSNEHSLSEYKGEEIREIPVVVPEREDKFIFNELSVASETVKDSEEPKNMNFSIDELKKIQISSERDDDFEELLAKVEKSRQDEETSRHKKANAEKDFESSAKILKSAAQRYDNSNKALEEVKARAYAYLNEIEANIEDNMKKERELRAMTEQQIQEARKIEAVADQNEAHIEQFNSVLTVTSEGKLNSNDNIKTYSRGQSTVA